MSSGPLGDSVSYGSSQGLYPAEGEPSWETQWSEGAVLKENMIR